MVGVESHLQSELEDKTARNNTDRLLLQTTSHETCLVGGELSTPYFFPQNIPTLRPQQVCSEQLVLIVLQAPGGFGMNLVDEPLDDDAGIDDVRRHRSRSSAWSTP